MTWTDAYLIALLVGMAIIALGGIYVFCGLVLFACSMALRMFRGLALVAWAGRWFQHRHWRRNA
jgi:hypothetical protein